MRQLTPICHGVYFGPDTQYPPSHATPEVWSNAAKFAAEKQAFFVATDKPAAIAGTPDEEQAAAAYRAVESTCRSCHKTFKTR
jgi:cytochrome c556